MGRRSREHQRKILRITPSEDVGRRGNPHYWRILLECGHITFEHHSRRRMMHAVTYQYLQEHKKDIPTMKTHCCKCALSEPIDVNVLCLGDMYVLQGEPRAVVRAAFGLDKNR